MLEHLKTGLPTPESFIKVVVSKEPAGGVFWGVGGGVTGSNMRAVFAHKSCLCFSSDR